MEVKTWSVPCMEEVRTVLEDVAQLMFGFPQRHLGLFAFFNLGLQRSTLTIMTLPPAAAC